MKKITLLSAVVLLAFFLLQGADTLQIKQTKIPILKDRADNVLFYIRIAAEKSTELNELQLRFSGIDEETVGILYESSVAHMTFQAVKLADIIKTRK